MRLSLCLVTFKRADYIGETLDTILPQLVEGVELVIVDGASPDDTEEVVRRHVGDHPRVRYVREQENSGVDADYDKSVGYAAGEHCWLVADDDLIVPDAVARVLDVLAEEDPDLLVVDAEVRDRSLANVLDERRLPLTGLRRYGPADGDALMADAGNGLSFIGCTVVRRSMWMERERRPYFGSLFIHVGVIFQRPLAKAVVLGEPLVHIRLGNAMWSARSFEIWMFKWPDLIWSFDGFSDAAKAAVVPREPWRKPLRLFLYRANGAYDLAAYRRFFAARSAGAWRVLLALAAIVPGRLANLLAAGLLSLRGQGRSSGSYNLLACSPYATRLSRGVVRALAGPAWLERSGAR